MPIRTAIRGARRVIRGWLNIFRREPWWAEFWSATAAMGWTMISLNSHEALSERPALAALTALAGPWFWEMSGLTLGLLQLLVLAFNERLCRWGVAVLFSWWWALVALGIYAQDPNAPSVALYVAFAGVNLFSLFRLLKHYP